ncbi:hypothetical protein RM572_12355 [Streptomyces sp. DSM 42041]|uniref:Secreted protein n=1 Tax=Streptomyces hazeniae TaxID=3075538 RepID=A0ABU2NRE6_9ACTN|nr:hypothetical protein [Streptomyces sp. DSM 42041]MDT0379557.1 hypothetical protein [Streptomyces sp. DSM 42041]
MTPHHHRVAAACLLVLTAIVLLLTVLPHPPSSPVDDPASAHRAAVAARAVPQPEQAAGHPQLPDARRPSAPDGCPADPVAWTYRSSSAHSATACARAPLAAGATPRPAATVPAAHETRAAGTRRPGPVALSPAVLQTFRC